MVVTVPCTILTFRSQTSSGGRFKIHRLLSMPSQAVANLFLFCPPSICKFETSELHILQVKEPFATEKPRLFDYKNAIVW